MRKLLTAPATNDRGPRYMERALAAIHQSNCELWPITLEYASSGQQVGLSLHVPDPIEELIIGPIAANYPNCSLATVSPDDVNLRSHTWLGGPPTFEQQRPNTTPGIFAKSSKLPCGCGWHRSRSPIQVLPRSRAVGSWLNPLNRADESAEAVPPGRVSNKGCLLMSLADWLQLFQGGDLLDWSGRQLRADQTGTISTEMPPILERLQITEQGWGQLSVGFGRIFRRAAAHRPRFWLTARSGAL